ncbi:MAG: phosphoglycerate mutase family protein [Longimicrobiales bacterium]
MRRHRPPGRRAHRRRRAAAALLAVLAATFRAPTPTAAQAAPTDSAVPEPTVIYLVRHAETADGSRNPALSPEGMARARWLTVILSHARLDAVYTTDYERTRSTARPVAAAARVRPTLYDPPNLPALARALRERGGRVLVVGHSNTTPALAAALGGDGGPPILESEYDRLYTLVIRGDSVRTVMLRY